jgi:hypothetical protein
MIPVSPEVSMNDLYLKAENKRLAEALQSYYSEVLALRATMGTLDSERACNAILTDELEVLREQLERYENVFGII